MTTNLLQLTIAVAGLQKARIQAVSGSRELRPHIYVEAGVLSFDCLSRMAIVSWAEGWAIARDVRADVANLPEWVHASTSQRRNIVTGIAVGDRYVLPTVLAMPAAATDEDTAYVQVEIGPLAVRAYDRQAIRSLADIWTNALAQSQYVWPAERMPTLNGPDVLNRQRRQMRRLGIIVKKDNPV